MNNWHGIGNLTRDPELRYSTGEKQTAVCKFTVAINDGYGDKQQTNYIPVTVFGKQAESCEKYLSKGKKVAVSGRIQTGSYTNKEGNKVYTTDIIADRVEFLSPANGGGQSAPAATGGGNAQPPQEAQQSFTEMADDDIPF